MPALVWPGEVATKLKELKASLTTVPSFPARPAVSTATLLRQVIERVDRIEKRLDTMEKKGPGKPDPER